MNSLRGKVALVTGGGQGLGFAMAKAFLEAGASVAITGRHGKKLQTASDLLAQTEGEVLILPGDAGNRDDVNLAVARTVEHFGKLDILVNNAQTTIDSTPFADVDDQSISSVLNSGLMGTIYFMQAAFPHLRNDGGSVINLGSRQGIHGQPGLSIYAATKEAIRGLTRTTAREWGQYKIRVNVICPAALSEAAAAYLDENPEERDMYLSEISLGYFGDAYHDVAPVAVFLASDAGRYLTGQTINVDGGYVML